MSKMKILKNYIGAGRHGGAGRITHPLLFYWAGRV